MLEVLDSLNILMLSSAQAVAINPVIWHHEISYIVLE